MAWYFELAAEFGDDLAGAGTFARFFDEVRLQRPDDTECFNLDAGAQQGQSGRWWAVVVPREIGRTGASSAEEASRMTRAGLLLYEKLRHAPRYRFAAVGVEPFDFRDLEGLAEIISSPALNGLVLSEPVWQMLGSPPRFVLFAPGYRWVPYRGEQEAGTVGS